MKMDCIFVLKILFLLFSSIYVLWNRISSYLNFSHEKDIAQRGHLLQGRVEKIIFNPFGSSMTRRHYSKPVVSFFWDGSRYQLKTLTTVPHKKYTEGSDIELLYLPEYSRKVIVKGEELRSGIGFLWDTLMIVFCLACVVIGTVNI
jgi:hypothetical protein